MRPMPDVPITPTMPRLPVMCWQRTTAPTSARDGLEEKMAKSRREQIEAMLAEDANDVFLWYGLAMEYVSAGDNEAALKTFAELQRRFPDYVPAYVQSGQVLTKLG